MKHNKWLRTALMTFILANLLWGGGWLRPHPGNAQETADVFSHGSGATEVFIFTDYFCPPCQAVEPYLEAALSDLLKAGLKVTFVDKPIDRRTPLYSRYFLYAANHTDSFEELLHIRRVLFDIARGHAVDSESALVRLLKENDVNLKLFNVRPVFDKWTQLIGRFGVRSTPTCIVTRPGQADTVLSGGRAIPEGLDRLLKEIAAGI